MKKRTWEHVGLNEIAFRLTNRDEWIEFLRLRFRRSLVYEEVGKLTVHVPYMPFPETIYIADQYTPHGIVVVWKKLPWCLCWFKRHRWIDLF
jgi:hypothetical protein